VRATSRYGATSSAQRNRSSIQRAKKLVCIKQNSPNTTVLSTDGAKPEWELCLQLLEDEKEVRAASRVSQLRVSYPLLTMLLKHSTGCSNHDTAVHKCC
jgi:hypothetical protein